ncbi:hypothetical protein ARMSODRAFT_1004510 [Armillaria solidipes]|uniref:Uncharacterized protein n=1 Tax=Armillaria solidipes TaxID=1076256 RepID=A0A2H3BEF7_9AGAR|nr:hypothetical protein ARMSODRAFT_1004510 [Armillaria solidipes]
MQNAAVKYLMRRLRGGSSSLITAAFKNTLAYYQKMRNIVIFEIENLPVKKALGRSRASRANSVTQAKDESAPLYRPDAAQRKVQASVFGKMIRCQTIPHAASGCGDSTESELKVAWTKDLKISISNRLRSKADRTRLQKVRTSSDPSSVQTDSNNIPFPELEARVSRREIASVQRTGELRESYSSASPRLIFQLSEVKEQHLAGFC